MAISFFKKKVDTFDYDRQRSCKNCGASYAGRFCNKCGEKVVEPSERTVNYFLGHIFNAFTFVDGKFWNSLKSLITHPGKMSLDIAEGKSKPYMQPVALFFVGNLIYFLIPIYQTFNSNLYSQMHYMVYSDMLSISEIVESRLARDNVDFGTFAEQYANTSKDISKTVLILFAINLVVFISLINYSRTKLFADHILFGLELASFVILYLTIILGVVFWLLGLTLSFFFSQTNLIRDDVFFSVALPLFIYFIVRGIKTFYGNSWRTSFVKSVFSFVALVISIELYRLIVFTITMYLL